MQTGSITVEIKIDTSGVNKAIKKLKRKLFWLRLKLSLKEVFNNHKAGFYAVLYFLIITIVSYFINR